MRVRTVLLVACMTRLVLAPISSAMASVPAVSAMMTVAEHV